MTKILYLSLSNEKYSANYFPFLKDYIASVAAADTTVELRGARVGRIDSYRFWESAGHDLDPRFGAGGRTAGLRCRRDRQHPRPGAA